MSCTHIGVQAGRLPALKPFKPLQRLKTIKTLKTPKTLKTLNGRPGLPFASPYTPPLRPEKGVGGTRALAHLFFLA
jgi:hypothetical protein